MKGLFQCLLVALCCLYFALTVLGDDSDFIDEKGKALRHLKGKGNYVLSSHPRHRLTDKGKPRFSSVSAKNYRLARTQSFHLWVNEAIQMYPA